MGPNLPHETDQAANGRADSVVLCVLATLGDEISPALLEIDEREGG